VRELKEQAGIAESFALARLSGELTDYGGFEAGRTLLLLDEADMAATRETAVVLAHAERADKLRTAELEPHPQTADAGVDRADGPARSVVDVVEAVVSPGDDAVADRELAVWGVHRLPQSAGRSGPVAGAGVQALARGVVAGDERRLPHGPPRPRSVKR